MCVCVCVGGGADRNVKCITSGLHFERGVTLVFDNTSVTPLSKKVAFFLQCSIWRIICMELVLRMF